MNKNDLKLNAERLIDDMFNKEANIMLIQRRLILGYQKAARIMEYLEKQKIVSKKIGREDRKMLLSKDETLRIIDYDKIAEIVNNYYCEAIDKD
jgi:DNA segregation ATPase FtsK/SpoIIIE-like protein